MHLLSYFCLFCFIPAFLLVVAMPTDADAAATERAVVPTTAHHVSIKPPPFMECAVPGWFAIMEAQFHLAKLVSQETKFYHILASLPATTIAKLDLQHWRC